MHLPISPADLATLLDEADAAARRLVRQLQLPRAELEDLRQDLLVDLLARMPEFDPERGSLGAFAGIVFRNRATRIAKKAKRDRQFYGAIPVSLDDTLAETDGLTRGDLVAEEEGLAAYFGQPVNAFAEVERRLDVERGLGTLDHDDGALCASLSRSTADRLAAEGHGARTTLYRRVKEIRLALIAHGVVAT